MAGLFDYIEWRGDLDFNVSPFNPVDNIILSQLAYLTLDGIVPSPEEREGISIDLAVRVYNEKIKEPGFKLSSIFKEDHQLIRALGSSRRFGDCQLFGYVNHVDARRELQFSAVCIHISDGYTFVAFRGTDCSIVGWKEDFNMCFKDVIPSQIEAVKYLEKMAPMIRNRLRVGGHSKGGNLAIYASANCDNKIKKRIKNIYCNDAPGFNDNFLSSKNFKEIRNRIQFFVPQASIIGMFMDHGADTTVIKSNEDGIMQHNLYSWEVTYNDLVRAERATVSSKFINNTLRGWLENIDNEKREQFIESLYHILSMANIQSTAELETSWFSITGRVLKSLSSVEESKRKIIRETISELFVSAGRNIETLIKPEQK
ncbi:MAG: DUF2974 domain-containing protein [Treponema sp.]|nr:DUF2974 domain-containing protein [Treponema sp.]